MFRKEIDYQRELEKGLDKLLGEIKTAGDVVLGLQYVREFEKENFNVGKYLLVFELLNLEKKNHERNAKKLTKQYISKN